MNIKNILEKIFRKKPSAEVFDILVHSGTPLNTSLDLCGFSMKTEQEANKVLAEINKQLNSRPTFIKIGSKIFETMRITRAEIKRRKA